MLLRTPERHQRTVLRDVDDARVLLENWRAEGHMTASADVEQCAPDAAEEIAERLPSNQEKRRVEVSSATAAAAARRVDLVLPRTCKTSAGRAAAHVA